MQIENVRRILWFIKRNIKSKPVIAYIESLLEELRDEMDRTV